jgi:hypothetical protein
MNGKVRTGRTASVLLLSLVLTLPASAQVTQRTNNGGVPQRPSDSQLYGNQWSKPQSWQQAPTHNRDPLDRRPDRPCRFGEKPDAISLSNCR